MLPATTYNKAESIFLLDSKEAAPDLSICVVVQVHTRGTNQHARDQETNSGKALTQSSKPQRCYSTRGSNPSGGSEQRDLAATMAALP